jgi:hypothetical protein
MHLDDLLLGLVFEDVIPIAEGLEVHLGRVFDVMVWVTALNLSEPRESLLELLFDSIVFLNGLV